MLIAEILARVAHKVFCASGFRIHRISPREESLIWFPVIIMARVDFAALPEDFEDVCGNAIAR